MLDAGALVKVGAKTYSLGEPRVDPATGKPNTFAFGFKALADAPAGPFGPSYVAIGDSTTTGHGVRDCPSATHNSRNHPYRCAEEPPPRVPYPDALATLLGPPYSDGYKVAPSGDYRTRGPETPNPYYNRVGVFGTTVFDVLEDYKKAEARGDDRRMGEPDADGKNAPVTPWESQLHALRDVEDLVTVHLGVDDMEYYDKYWITNYFAGNLDGKLEGELEGFGSAPEAGIVGEPGLRPLLDELFDEHLAGAQKNGAEVSIVSYPLAIADKPECKNSFQIQQGVVGAVNDELQQRAEAKGMTFVDIEGIFTQGVDRGLGSADPMVLGEKCNIMELGGAYLPDWLYQMEDEGDWDESLYLAVDPHPDDRGHRMIAEEIQREVEAN